MHYQQHRKQAMNYQENIGSKSSMSRVTKEFLEQKESNQGKQSYRSIALTSATL